LKLAKRVMTPREVSIRNTNYFCTGMGKSVYINFPKSLPVAMFAAVNGLTLNTFGYKSYRDIN